MKVRVKVLHLQPKSHQWEPWWSNYIANMLKDWSSTNNTINFTSSTDYIIEQLNKKIFMQLVKNLDLLLSSPTCYLSQKKTWWHSYWSGVDHGQIRSKQFKKDS